MNTAEWFWWVALPIALTNCVDNLDEAPRSGLKEATARIEVLEARLAEVEAPIQDEFSRSGMCTCE